MLSSGSAESAAAAGRLPADAGGGREPKRPAAAGALGVDDEGGGSESNRPMVAADEEQRGDGSDMKGEGAWCTELSAQGRIRRSRPDSGKVPAAGGRWQWWQ